jgi:MFS family permease
MRQNMQLWLACLLALIGAVLIAVWAVRRNRKKRWLIAVAIAGALVILLALAYILLALVFLDAASNQPPDETPVTSVAWTTPMRKVI